MARAIGRLRGRQPSIRLRLTLLFASCTCAVLLAATALLYWAVTASIARDDQRLLAEKVYVLRTMLSQRPNDLTLLNEEVDWETGVLGQARYFVQVLDRDGQVIAVTPGLAQSGITAQAFPAPIALSIAEPQPAWVTTAAGRRYLLTAALARLGTEGPAQRIIRIAFDVSHQDRILRDFRNIAAFVLLAGVVLAAGLGAEITRRGLRPLEHMAQTVQATTITELHQRIDPAAWPGELTGLAQAFNRLLAHLEQAVARLTGYAADLAHELRTPLNNLMGETGVILAKPHSRTAYRETLESNLEEYQRLARMIDRLLFLARAESPASQIQLVRLDAARELAEVIEFHAPAAEEAGVRLDGNGQATLFADRDLVRRAISNLLSNAITHTPSGGEVVACARQHDDGAVELAVTDTGRGMTPEETARACERFYRGAESRQRAAGSGLGLAIVKTIMTLHQGQVDVESRPGRGARITLRFPPPATGR